MWICSRINNDFCALSSSSTTAAKSTRRGIPSSSRFRVRGTRSPPRSAGLVSLEVSGREQALGEAAVEAVSGGRGRRFWLAAATAVLAAAGGVAAAVVVFTGGSGSGAAAPAGNALAVINPTGREV